MKIILFSGALVFILMSCNQMVVLKTQLHHSHCGGVPPTAETINGYHTAHDMYVTIVGENDSINIRVVENRKVKLRPGNYLWYRGEKQTATKDLFKELKFSLDKNLVIDGGFSCIDAWRNKPDGTFEVNRKTDSVKLILKYRCYTGTLPFPCVKYIGPKYP